VTDPETVSEFIANVRLIDHHCHGLISLSDARRYAGWVAGNASRVYGQAAP
jgi:hypothetical protein